MELKYAVVSSDSKPEYLDFWPYIANAWRRIGIEPVLLYIDRHEPSDEVKSHGTVFYLESIPEWGVAQQAQCIRFWAARLLDAPFIISDMDMLPIDGSYYKKGSAQQGDTGIISYSSDVIKYGWYRNNPQYPMCYLAGDPASFIEILDMQQESHVDFLRKLMNMKLKIGTDQVYFYRQSLIKKHVNIKHLERIWVKEKYAYKRLDKACWPTSDYSIDEYIDCHLPRPLENNLYKCQQLFSKLGIWKPE